MKPRPRRGPLTPYAALIRAQCAAGRLQHIAAATVALLCLTASGTITAAETKTVPHGRLAAHDGCTVLTLDGTPEEMGTAAGRLVGPTVRRVVRELVTEGIGEDPEALAALRRGARTMEEHQPERFRRELKALAEAARVSYEDLLLLQLHGDVARCLKGKGARRLCTAFAVLPARTRKGTCVVGRNLDYFDEGVSEYAAMLVHYRPAEGLDFVTVTWAGIINGWTLLNEAGIVTANNTVFTGRSSLNGISTCFLLRAVAEKSRTVADGIALVREAERACSTAMLIAGGTPPAAAVVEFDHDAMAVRKAVDSFVGAANAHLVLNRARIATPRPLSGRIGRAYAIVREQDDPVDYTATIADAPGVPIEGMNLHCVTIDTASRVFRVAMGGIPAYRRRFHHFALTGQGIEPREGPSSPSKRERP
jgi:hypothetical protein